MNVTVSYTFLFYSGYLAHQSIYQQLAENNVIFKVISKISKKGLNSGNTLRPIRFLHTICITFYCPKWALFVLLKPFLCLVYSKGDKKICEWMRGFLLPQGWGLYYGFHMIISICKMPPPSFSSEKMWFQQIWKSLFIA